MSTNFSESLHLRTGEIPRGTLFATKMNGFVNFTHFFNGGDDMNSSQTEREKSSESTTSLETIIALGLFGWLALSMTLMGLGIW